VHPDRAVPIATAEVPIATAAVLVLVATGCTFSTSSTAPRTVFGYDRPPRIALLMMAPDPLADGWRRALAESGRVVIAATPPLADAVEDELPARACRAALELTRAGTPVDAVLAVWADAATATNTRCLRTKHSLDVIDRILSDEDDTYCAEAVYDSTTGTVTSRVEVYDAATCRRTFHDVIESPPRTSKLGSETADVEDARRRSIDQHVQVLRTIATPAMFPAGLQVMSVAERAIEVSNRGHVALAPGELLVVRGHPPGPPGPRGRVQVTTVDGDRATLEAERDGLGVGPGDELRRQVTGHRWTLSPALIVGAVRRDDGTSATAGLQLGFRWSPQRVPIFAEVLGFGDSAPGIGLRHSGLGLAAGVRVERGSLAPYAFAEAGALGAYQPATVPDRRALATGTWLGAGFGAELAAGRALLQADLRWRRMSTGTWTVAEVPVEVGHPDRRTTAIVLGLAAAYRY